MLDMREATAGAQRRSRQNGIKRTSDRDSTVDAARDGGSGAPRDVVTGGHKEPRHTRFDRGATEAMAVTAAGATRQVLRAWELSQAEVEAALRRGEPVISWGGYSTLGSFACFGEIEIIPRPEELPATSPRVRA